MRHVPRFNARMPDLTRRRSEDRHDCWHISDVQAGTIVMRVGNPHDTEGTGSYDLMWKAGSHG